MTGERKNKEIIACEINSNSTKVVNNHAILSPSSLRCGLYPNHTNGHQDVDILDLGAG